VRRYVIKNVIVRIVSQVDRGAPRPGGGGIEGLARDHATQHYAAIVESSDDAILSKDLDGIITVGTKALSGSLAIRPRKPLAGR
jgi:hypothetical protein